MRSSFALFAAGSLAITALGRLVDFETAPEANMASSGNLTAQPLGGGNPDVIVWDLQSYANYGPAAGYHAYALGTTSCNQGDVPLLWQSNTNLHPVIGQNMYRWKDGRFEQIGMGWLKHGFFALSLSDCGPCQSTDGTTLGVNCSDPYTANRNGSQGGLGPKYQVNATTGFFPYPPADPSYSGSTARRCRVPSADVIPSQNPGAVYFMEGQYVCPDDSPDDTGDASNNSSHRRLNMASSGAISSFDGPTIQELPAIASWDDLDPEVDLHEIEIPGEGTIWFGSRVFDEGDGTFHTTLLERHNTMVLILGVKPSVDREDEDIGEVELEVISSEDASVKTTVSFTIQRTYGIRGEISQDCDGTPLGHMKVSLCSPGQNNPYMEFRARITNSDTELDAASWWLLQEPQDLSINTDRNPAYGNWVFEIRDTDGNSLPRISLGPGDFTEVQITAELTSQVEAGNHTVFLRIVEETEEDEPRYFDLPITFEVESDQPMLQIVQKDPNSRLSPGNEYSIRMEVQNDGNSPMTVLLSADVESSGWDVSIGGLSGSPLIEIEAFGSATFTLEISVPESANNGDEIPIVISATPLDTEQSFSESQTAKFTLTAMVEIGSFSQIIANEISHPRPITIVLLVVGTILLFAGVQTRFNRRRWAKQMKMIESLSEVVEEVPNNESQIPAPVTIPEAPETVDRYDDEDVELI